jgi:hypothetical protein
MAGHAHRRRLIQFVASAFALGSIVWPSSPHAMDQPPPNKAAAPQQMTLPSASKSNEPISVTSFEFGSFRPNPIVLESMTIAEYLLVVELDGPNFPGSSSPCPSSSITA